MRQRERGGIKERLGNRKYLSGFPVCLCYKLPNAVNAYLSLSLFLSEIGQIWAHDSIMCCLLIKMLGSYICYLLFSRVCACTEARQSAGDPAEVHQGS